MLMTCWCTSLSIQSHVIHICRGTSVTSFSGLKTTFNTSKCKCMLLTNRRSIFPPTLNNQPLELVQQMKYLGLIVSHNLSWSQHIQATCKKARKMLGIMYYQFCSNNSNSLTTLKLYIALVRLRPWLECIRISGQ